MTQALCNASITVNGVDEPLVAPDVATLVAGKGIDPDQRGIAVAVNGQVVPRADWASTLLRTGDRVEIVRARQGG